MLLLRPPLLVGGNSSPPTPPMMSSSHLLTPQEQGEVGLAQQGRTGERGGRRGGG